MRLRINELRTAGRAETQCDTSLKLNLPLIGLAAVLGFLVSMAVCRRRGSGIPDMQDNLDM